MTTNTPKDWRNATAHDGGGDTSTPLSAAALEDMESRVMPPWYNVVHYGAVGDGATDDTTAVQDACTAAGTAGGGIVFAPAGTYNISYVSIPAAVVVRGVGRNSVFRLANSSAINTKRLFQMDEENAGIEDLMLDGNGANQSTAHTSESDRYLVWISGTACWLERLEFRDGLQRYVRVTTAGVGARISSCFFNGNTPGQTNISRNCIEIRASLCRVVGNGFVNLQESHGVRVGLEDGDLPSSDYVEDVLVAHNSFSDFDNAIADSPCMKGEVHATGTTWIGNHARAMQRAFKFDSCDYQKVIGNTLSELTSVEGINATDAPFSIFQGNSMFDCAAGIQYGTDCKVIDNIFQDIGVGVASTTAGVIRGVSDSNRTLIQGNRIANGYRRIIEGVGEDQHVLNNYISDCTGDTSQMIRVGSDGSANGHVADNTIESPVSVAQVIYGLGNRLVIRNNRLIGTVPAGITGVRVSASINSIVEGNLMTSTTTAVSFDSDAQQCRARDNLPGGTVTIASAATLTPPPFEAFGVSGSTTITNITVTDRAERKITLLFTSTAQVTDGGNLVLAGNFTGGAGRTLTLVSDGSNWYEMGRSVN